MYVRPWYLRLWILFKWLETKELPSSIHPSILFVPPKSDVQIWWDISRRYFRSAVSTTERKKQRKEKKDYRKVSKESIEHLEKRNISELSETVLSVAKTRQDICFRDSQKNQPHVKQHMIYDVIVTIVAVLRDFRNSRKLFGRRPLWVMSDRQVRIIR